jgi:cytidine deaminase
LAQTFARPVISGFRVGAVVQGSSGSLYLGANFEIAGHALGLTAHAEQAALANAYMCGEDGVSAIGVTAAPCGHCRQFLNEFSLDGDLRVLLQGRPAVLLSELLPITFGPKALGAEQGALPIRRVDLALVTPATDPLMLVALDAARRSHAPYTGSHAGIAIRTSEGRVYAGSYIENAAFNPSLSPFHSALAGLFAAGVDAGDVTEAALVEVEGAKISQESFVRLALTASAPDAVCKVAAVRMP